MASHMYWTFVCKTEGCSARHDFEYLGVFNTLPVLNVPIPEPFKHDCERCGQSHTYSYLDLNLGAKSHPPLVKG
jgi:hypothetical protein